MNKFNFWLLSILILAAFLRLWNLGQIPNGFIPEEVSSGWNAYSILKTGRDEWGVALPLIFRETGGYKLALGSYLIVPSIAIFGLTEFAVRFPFAIAGIVAVYGTYLVAQKLFNHKRIALTAAFLLAISPWHVCLGRYGVDVNWGVTLFIFGIYFFLTSLQKPKLLVVSGICFSLTYFTYFNYVVFTVFFIFGLCVVCRREIFKNKKMTAVFMAIQLIGLSVYFFDPALFIRFRQATAVDRIGFVNRINEHRGACETVYPKIVCRITYNKFSERVYEIARNYSEHFSTPTLFVNGSKLGLSGMPDNWGLLYIFELPLIVIGIVKLVYAHKFPRILLLWTILYGIPGSLASSGHIWRMLTLLPLPYIFSAVGLVWLFSWQRLKLLNAGYITVIAVLVARFWVDYTAYFPYVQSPLAFYGFRDVYSSLRSLESSYEAIVVAPQALSFEQLYIYYLFYMRSDPRAYQQGIDVDRPTGEQNWVHVNRIGKWHFISDIKNLTDELPDRFVYVADGRFTQDSLLPQNLRFIRTLKTIYYPNNDPDFQIVELQKKKIIPSL